MKKKASKAKKNNSTRPNYVAEKHWASEVTFRLTFFPLLVTIAFTAVALGFGWFEAVAGKVNGLLGSDIVSANIMLAITIAVGGIVTIKDWIIQAKRIKKLKKFRVNFYDDIIELKDEDGVTRRTFYGFVRYDISLPPPSIIVPENCPKLIKRILCWKPLKFDYGNVFIECLEGPSDKIRLYCIKNPKKLIKHLESLAVETDIAAAECTVEFGK